MLLNDSAYLPTDKLYQTPQYEAYNVAKHEHILSSIPHYANYRDDQVQEKWSALMAAFAEALNDSHMPHDITRQELQEQLRAFKHKRENTAESENNLNLKQCVNYFENFYFLYTTTTPEYKLRDASKKNLLNAIKEAMAVCETGINSQFRAVLQEYKKDSDWIKNELSKARCNTLHELHLQYQQNRQAYLAQFAQVVAEDTHNVHTLNTLIASANEADLGITIGDEISDVFAHLFPKDETIAYFQEHYPALFRNYEKQSIAILTNYYLGELASTLNIDSAAWAAGELNISVDKSMTIQDSIDGYFQDVDTRGYTHRLGEFSDDDTSFTLKTKRDVEIMIKQLVREKLVADKYYVSIDDIDDIAAEPDAHPELRIKKGIERDDLLAVHRAFEQANPRVIHETLKQHVSILICYPELALSQLHKNPALISSLPIELKNDTRFTDMVLSSLNEKLGQAIIEREVDHERINQQRINQLTTQLLNLIQAEAGYVQELSESVRDFIAPQLGQIIPDNFNWHKERIETQEFIAHVSQLNPSQLLSIIEQRKQTGLSPLPFFEYDGAIHNLKQFHAELSTELTSDWNQSPLAMRRRACEQAAFSWLTHPQDKKNAVTYLAQTSTWFAGFTQYHAYQTSFERLWQEIVLVAKACFRLALSLLRLGIMYVAFTWLVPMIASLIQPIFWPLFLIGLAFCFSDNLSLIFTGLGLLFLASLPYLAWVYFGLGVLCNIVDSAYNAYGVVCALFNTLSTGFDIITVMLSSRGVNADRNNTLENTCENILVRLDSIDDISAQEKSDVLRTLLSQVKADVSDEAEHTFAELLKHKYSIFYHGDEHEVSFSDVSNIRRPYYGGFQLEETSSCMRFFSGKTSSDALMATAETQEYQHAN